MVTNSGWAELGELGLTEFPESGLDYTDWRRCQVKLARCWPSSACNPRMCPDLAWERRWANAMHVVWSLAIHGKAQLPCRLQRRVAAPTVHGALRASLLATADAPNRSQRVLCPGTGSQHPPVAATQVTREAATDGVGGATPTTRTQLEAYLRTPLCAWPGSMLGVEIWLRQSQKHSAATRAKQHGTSELCTNSVGQLGGNGELL